MFLKLSCAKHRWHIILGKTCTPRMSTAKYAKAIQISKRWLWKCKETIPNRWPNMTGILSIPSNNVSAVDN